LKHGIRRKVVANAKCYPEKHLASYSVWKTTLQKQMRLAAERGLRIVWLDEVNFTKKSIQTVEWSARHRNLCISQDDVYFGYRSVIAAVSAEKGVELLRI
jgi:hypothetical protein